MAMDAALCWSGSDKVRSSQDSVKSFYLNTRKKLGWQSEELSS